LDSVEIHRVTNRHILPTVASRLARIVARRDQAGSRLLKHLWIEAKRYSAPNVRNVGVEEIRGLSSIEVTGSVMSSDGMIVCDDYTYYPHLYAYLNELARSLNPPDLTYTRHLARRV
jgi:hypothetical protein